MSSTWGERVRISIFGGSHTKGIGVSVDGLPAGHEIDMEQVLVQMRRRAPGQDSTATKRKEEDVPEILCGISPQGFLSGDPVSAVIYNTDQRSRDYQRLDITPRPGHADYPAHVKYNGFNDIRGGGHFSGRLTAPLVFAGALCRQILEKHGITIGAHAYRIGSVNDKPFDALTVCAEELNTLNGMYFSVCDAQAGLQMKEEIVQAKSNGDSVGGIIECAAVGLEAGLGAPMFDGVENLISSIVFGIPAIKGIEFGAGFSVAGMKGSENNDPYYYEDSVVKTKTNHAGGILGGITTGMPLLFRVALKPTSSIAKQQDTVDLETGTQEKLIVRGRHDPCVLPRAIPVVEAAAAIALTELLLREGRLQGGAKT